MLGFAPLPLTPVSFDKRAASLRFELLWVVSELRVELRMCIRLVAAHDGLSVLTQSGEARSYPQGERPVTRAHRGLELHQLCGCPTERLRHGGPSASQRE
jgi:hypothetical protein